MKRRLSILLMAFTLAGCIKETYDMDKLSKEFSLSPAVGFSAVKGEVSIADLVDPDDTIVFDEDNFIRIIFKKDSVIDFKISDFYDLDNMVSFSESYVVGEIDLTPFTGTASFPLNQISAKFTPPVTYSTGTYPGFPSFPAIDIGERSFTPFPNFQYATLSEGTISITIKNNLPVALGGLTLKLFNTSTHTQIGNDITVPALAKGASSTGSINLANRTITNSVTVGAVLSATTGTASPVDIDLNTTNIEIQIEGKNMKVTSGRIIVPEQTVSSLDGHDTIDFDPGNDIEIDEIKITSGNLLYSLTGNIPLKATLEITMPSTSRNDIPITESITVNPNSTTNGTISVSNSIIDLGTIATRPYNSVPVDYNLEISSDGSMVTFNSTDEITFTLELQEPEFDYVKGYFGQQTESIDDDSLDLEINDILSHVTGDFLISNPSIRLNYSNSFAIPIKMDLKATGIRGDSKIDLGYSPFTLSYPAAPAERDKNSFLQINKDNSELPELISLPPEKVRFSGSAVMNPDGNSGARDNYLFDQSRFLGSLEIEVPLEFRMNNLHFADTLDNFLSIEESEDDETGFRPEDFEYLKVLIKAENGFPVGISVSMSLFDSTSMSVLSTVNADQLLEPATVDNNGKVTGTAVTETLIEITDEFWNFVRNAEGIIFSFTLNTTGAGQSKDVKIYSDYSIKFNAAVAGKAKLKF